MYTRYQIHTRAASKIGEVRFVMSARYIRNHLNIMYLKEITLNFDLMNLEIHVSRQKNMIRYVILLSRIYLNN